MDIKATADIRDLTIPLKGKAPIRKAVARSLGQRPIIAWLTGLSGSGKSTLANAAADNLRTNGRRVVILDGDDLRAGLNRDLGFTPADRNESVRRAAEMALLMADAGLIVIVALISPYKEGRATARQIAGHIPFLEIFVDTPHVVCENRDTKGLYARARNGSLLNFTSISDPYEVPRTPEMKIRAYGWTVQQSAAPLIAKMLDLSSL